MRIFVVLMALFLVFSATLFAKGGSGGEMNVELRQVVVKSSPNYLGSSVGTLNYGTKVNVIGEQQNWYQISSPAGWVPKSALTKHKVKVSADQKVAATSASHDEVALAGKGFNPQVEAQYKKDNASLKAAYAEVDKIEKFGVSHGTLVQFQKSGKLR
ncbi:MAG: SH3 domain-containing protein [Pseudomonadota bacterium]